MKRTSIKDLSKKAAELDSAVEKSKTKQAREGIEPPSTESESVVLTATPTSRAHGRNNLYIFVKKHWH